MYWGRGKNYDIEGAAGWQPWVLIRLSYFLGFKHYETFWMYFNTIFKKREKVLEN